MGENGGQEKHETNPTMEMLKEENDWDFTTFSLDLQLEGWSYFRDREHFQCKTNTKPSNEHCRSNASQITSNNYSIAESDRLLAGRIQVDYGLAVPTRERQADCESASFRL